MKKNNMTVKPDNKHSAKFDGAMEIRCNSASDSKLPDGDKVSWKDEIVELHGLENMFEGKTIKFEQLTRHFMIMGETGSGKTASMVAHLLEAALNIEGAAMLLIDPKQNELENVAKKVLKDRFDTLVMSCAAKRKKKGGKINFFEGWENISIEDKAEKLWELNPGALAPHYGTNNGGYFNEKAKTFFTNVLKLDKLIIEKTKGVCTIYSLIFDEKASEYFEGIKTFFAILSEPDKKVENMVDRRVQQGIPFIDELPEPDDTFDDLEQEILSEGLIMDESPEPDDPSTDLLVLINSIKRRNFSNWLECLLEVLRALEIEEKDCVFLSELLCNAAGMHDMTFSERRRQLGFDLDHCRSLMRVITNDKVKEIISFDPFCEGNSSDLISIREQIENGKIIIYSPDSSFSSDADRLIGKTLKMKFFQYVFTTFEDVKKPRRKPVFYICDEFQRYITSDEESGEQRFLDRCRAYNTTCVLATQSIASLLDTTKNECAIEVMLENTGNKIFFRSTSPKVTNRLKNLLPNAPIINQPHVIDHRPPTTLKPGECYYLLSNGSWGRTQLPMWAVKAEDSEKASCS